MATGSRSSAPNAREWDEEEEQGPRVFYSDERRWGATHRKWRWHGLGTKIGHAVEIRSKTWCASCTSGKGGNKGDERGSAQRGRRAGGHVTKRRKKGKGKWGVWYGERRCGAGSRPDARKRKSAQCARTASAARCCGHTKTESSRPDIDSVCRARSEMT